MNVATAEEGLPTPRRYVAIAALSLGSIVTVIDGTIATVALPTIASDLHVDAAASVLVVTVYQLVLVMMLLPCAGLGDRIGLTRFYQYGQMLFTVATLMCFFANSLPFLLLARALQALGAAATLSMMTAMIRNIYPKAIWGRGIATNSVVATIAAASAPTVGGLVITISDWRFVFAIAVPFALLSLWIGRRALPEIKPVDAPYNFGGALLNMATFGLIFTGLESGVTGDSPVISAAILLAGIAFAIWFVRRELAEDRPILPVDLLARPVLALSFAGSFFSFIAITLQTVSLPFTLQHLYGLSPGEVGAVLSPSALAMMLVVPIAGALSDKVPAGLLGGIGAGILTLSLILTAFPPPHPGSFDFAWRVALGGAGMALYLAPNSRLIMSETPRTRAAATGGLMSTTRLTGQTLGATLVATMLALGLGNSPIPMLVGAGCALLAAMFSLGRICAGSVPIRDAPAPDTPEL